MKRTVGKGKAHWFLTILLGLYACSVSCSKFNLLSPFSPQLFFGSLCLLVPMVLTVAMLLVLLVECSYYTGAEASEKWQVTKTTVCASQCPFRLGVRTRNKSKSQTPAGPLYPHQNHMKQVFKYDYLVSENEPMETMHTTELFVMLHYI